MNLHDSNTQTCYQLAGSNIASFSRVHFKRLKCCFLLPPFLESALEIEIQSKEGALGKFEAKDKELEDEIQVDLKKEEELRRKLEEVQEHRRTLEDDREIRRAMQNKADVVRIPWNSV